ncbi:MAG: hypothetical protein KGM46_09410 [Pseudomonadota bacterium]|jgi:transposase-like protein|nr:hypothetical protein [Xanthomonadaceae bacterium]MDE2247423.1 hypothetical protein [Xanthomonadaceae bacterium]MDE3210946.1 hypothetical protein [Pseudomonadota bacterium]
MKNYPVLPEGKVTCDACAQSGRRVEMKPHRQELPTQEARALPADCQLQSYRCPECEQVTFFEVR